MAERISDIAERQRFRFSPSEAARKSDFERSELNKEKTGVQLEGVMGINPVNDKEIPIFISDYVLESRLDFCITTKFFC